MAPRHSYPLKVFYTLNQDSQLILSRATPVDVVLFPRHTAQTKGNVTAKSKTSRDSLEGSFASVPLKACLAAICYSSPEIVANCTNAGRDYSVYAADPLEAILSFPGDISAPIAPPDAASGSAPHSTPSTSSKAVIVGKGLLSWALNEPDQASTGVVGTIVKDGGGESYAVEVVLGLREMPHVSQHEHNLAVQHRAPVPIAYLPFAVQPASGPSRLSQPRSRVNSIQSSRSVARLSSAAPVCVPTPAPLHTAKRPGTIQPTKSQSSLSSSSRASSPWMNSDAPTPGSSFVSTDRKVRELARSSSIASSDSSISFSSTSSVNSTSTHDALVHLDEDSRILLQNILDHVKGEPNGQNELIAALQKQNPAALAPLLQTVMAKQRQLDPEIEEMPRPATLVSRPPQLQSQRRASSQSLRKSSKIQPPSSVHASSDDRQVPRKRTLTGVLNTMDQREAEKTARVHDKENRVRKRPRLSPPSSPRMRPSTPPAPVLPMSSGRSPIRPTVFVTPKANDHTVIVENPRTVTNPPPGPTNITRGPPRPLVKAPVHVPAKPIVSSRPAPPVSRASSFKECDVVAQALANFYAHPPVQPSRSDPPDSDYDFVTRSGSDNSGYDAQTDTPSDDTSSSTMPSQPGTPVRKRRRSAEMSPLFTPDEKTPRGNGRADEDDWAPPSPSERGRPSTPPRPLTFLSAKKNVPFDFSAFQLPPSSPPSSVSASSPPTPAKMDLPPVDEPGLDVNVGSEDVAGDGPATNSLINGAAPSDDQTLMVNSDIDIDIDKCGAITADSELLLHLLNTDFANSDKPMDASALDAMDSLLGMKDFDSFDWEGFVPDGTGVGIDLGLDVAGVKFGTGNDLETFLQACTPSATM